MEGTAKKRLTTSFILTQAHSTLQLCYTDFQERLLCIDEAQKLRSRILGARAEAFVFLIKPSRFKLGQLSNSGF